ncbi:hypothetical protein TWF694_003983 [Orbilia ellipsospora]|uniref:Uncharacterized protein n=1 Tax=Orbilia ellipsospora TaxID=2528407 RepID=A0AAV9WWK5_9PEZI
MRWDSTADAKLFVAVLKVHSLKLNYEAIAKLMGDDTTAKAVSHRIAKLKSLGSDVGTPNTSPNTPTKTPTKRKRSDNTDLIAIKKEQIEGSLESDASSEAATTVIDAVSTGSPKKRRRQPKPAPAPPIEISFASTLEDSDNQSPHSTLYSPPGTSYEEGTSYEDFLNDFHDSNDLPHMSAQENYLLPLPNFFQ